MRAVAFDTETRLIKNYRKFQKIVCLTTYDGTDNKIFVGDDIKRELVSLLSNATAGNVMLVAHNAAFDMGCIVYSYPDLSDLVWSVYDTEQVLCTIAREKLLAIHDGIFEYEVTRYGQNIKRDYSLDGLTRRYFGRKLDKGTDSWRLRYGELEKLPISSWPDRAIDYAKDDPLWTLRIFSAQEAHARSIRYDLPTQYFETKAAWALALFGAWGLRINHEKVDVLWGKFVTQFSTNAQLLSKQGLIEFRPSTRSFLGRLGLPHTKKNENHIRAMVEKYYPGGNPPRTKKGKISITAEVIEACGPVFAGYKGFKEAEKIIGTYLVPLFKTIVHPEYYSIGGVTTRTSCRNPNIQNQPKAADIRACFIPRNGMVYCFADFDSQEMRSLAQACLDILGISKLAERYQADRHFDPHLEFACTLLGIPKAEGERRYAAKEPTICQMRSSAKVTNFGYPGGLAPSSMVSYAASWGIDITLEKAEYFKREWLKQWPEIPDYFRYMQNLCGGFGKTGTQILASSGLVRGNMAYTQSCNGEFQGRAAESSKLAVYETARKMYHVKHNPLYGCRAGIFVHDEIGAEFPKDGAHICAKELSSTMVEAMESVCKDVPAAVEAALSFYWTKKAKPVYKNGVLVPWEG